jgi:hypothetical protein
MISAGKGRLRREAGPGQVNKAAAAGCISVPWLSPRRGPARRVRRSACAGGHACPALKKTACGACGRQKPDLGGQGVAGAAQSPFPAATAARAAGVSPPSSSVGCSARVSRQVRCERRYSSERCFGAPIPSPDGRWWLRSNAGRRSGGDAVPALSIRSFAL